MNKVLTRICAGDGRVYLEVKQRDSPVHAKEIERGRDSERVQTVPADRLPLPFETSGPFPLIVLSHWPILSMARFSVSGENFITWSRIVLGIVAKFRTSYLRSRRAPYYKMFMK
jgi:hypothetical protein